MSSGRSSDEPVTSGDASTESASAVEDLRRLEAELAEARANERRLAEAQSVSNTGCSDYDVKTGTLWWSDQFYRILGIEPASVVPSLDDYLAFVLEADRQLVLDGIREMYRTGKGRSVDVRLRRATGQEIVILATTTIYTGEDGKVARQLTTIQDVTELRELERSRITNEEFLRKAQKVANLGTWEVNLQTGDLKMSDELYRICGIEPGTWAGTREEAVKLMFHPDDHQQSYDAWAAMLEAKDPYQLEHRVVRPDGECRTLITRGRTLYDESGNAWSAVGASHDVTEMRMAQEALRVSEERLALAARGSTDGMWDWPNIKEDRFWISARYAEMIGLAPERAEMSMKELQTKAHPDDLAAAMSGAKEQIRQRSSFDLELRMKSKNDEYRWFRLRGERFQSSGDRPPRISGSLLDIHAQKSAELQVEHYQARLRSLAAAVSEAAERERRRIAAELHDRTVQTLGALRMKLSPLKSAGEQTLDDSQREEVFSLIDLAIGETRELLHEIGPPVLYELGFEAAVDWLAERTRKQYGVECVIDVDHELPAIPDDVQMALFQCIRELFANVGKHADASRAELVILWNSDRLMVRLSDDGCGFDVAGLSVNGTASGGYGLFSVRERLRVVDGGLAIDSAPGQGSRVTMTVPMSAPPPSTGL